MMRILSVLMVALCLAGCATESCRDRACSPDETLVEAVKANIALHPALLSDHIRVRADQGVVYLSGFVSTGLELSEVEDVAKATPGVTRVINDCAIENMYA